MSNRVSEGVNTNEARDETHRLSGHEPQDFNSAGGTLSSPVTSKDVARQIKAASDPLAEQLDHLSDLSKEF